MLFCSYCVFSLIAVSQEDFSDCDLLMVAISSHGKLSEPEFIEKRCVLSRQGKRGTSHEFVHVISEVRSLVWATDKTISINELLAYFSEDRCPTLIGKPKIFINQVSCLEFCL